ncbi:MAG: DUF2460 domain-containing protein [Acetobacteraceae bacterium]|nr:DUF2460 domain-containing protein [Acetobacteraceae bacterium]
MSLPSFIEERLPDAIAYRTANGGPEWNTRIVISGGGYEQRNARWAAPLRSWDAARGIRTTADLFTVMAFHTAVQGRLIGWRFKDFLDFQAFGESIDTSGGGPSWQLRKAYMAGQTLTFYRTIVKPVLGTVSLQWNGTPVDLQSPGAGSFGEAPLYGETPYGGQQYGSSGIIAALDYTTGLITNVANFAPQPGDTLQWWGEFDVPVRFDVDKISASPVSDKLWDWGSIPVKEVRR